MGLVAVGVCAWGTAVVVAIKLAVRAMTLAADVVLELLQTDAPRLVRVDLAEQLRHLVVLNLQLCVVRYVTLRVYFFCSSSLCLAKSYISSDTKSKAKISNLSFALRQGPLTRVSP